MMEPMHQPERLTQWSATFHERRTAVFIAGVCIVVIAAAMLAPQWFASKPEQVTEINQTNEATGAQTSDTPVERPTYRIDSNTPVASVTARTPVSNEIIEPAPAVRPVPAPKPVVTAPAPEPAKTTPTVTSPPKPKPVTTIKPSNSSTTVSKAPTGYFVQVGAFKERKLADNLLKKLTSNGFNTRLIDRSNGMIGVWIGPEDTHKAAEMLQRELQKKLKLQGFITHSG